MRNARLLEKFQAAEKDPELVSLRGALSMVKVRVFELIDRIDTGESPERWRQALEAWSDFKGKRNSMMESKAFAALDDIMEAAYHDYMAWKQIFDALDLERRLSESERMRLKDMHQMMTAEDIARIVTQLQMAIIRIVDDPRKLKQIEHEFIRISGIGAVPGVEGSGRQEVALGDASGLGAIEFLDSRTPRADSP